MFLSTSIYIFSFDERKWECYFHGDRSLPGGSRRKKVPGGGDHPEPQAQVPPVQGEQEGLDNVSMA